MTDDKYSPTNEEFGIDDIVVNSNDVNYTKRSEGLSEDSNEFKDPSADGAGDYDSIHNIKLPFNPSSLLAENGSEVSNGRKQNDATDLRSNRPKRNTRWNVAPPPRNTQMTLKEQERVSAMSLHR